MNATVKNTAAHRHPVSLHLPFRSLLSLRKRWTFVSLVAAVLLSAFLVVFVANLNHELIAQQQELLAVQQQMHNQWGELQVEQGTVSSEAAVANTARQDLGMTMPSSRNVVMVQQ